MKSDGTPPRHLGGDPDRGGCSLSPWDEHDQRLVQNVRPADWVNPAPAPRYDLVVIGGGPAGLVTAAGAAAMGARVALVERHLLGGDCLNTGCVPSKALLRAARAVAAVRNAGNFGVQVEGEVRVDFGAVMERLRRLRADISPHDSAARFRGLGVDVFLGEARFTGPGAVEVAGRTLKFARAVIATGARPAMPPIPGLDAVPVLTNETLFSLTEQPRSLAIVGAGPIGCEMAQAFARFGTEVHLVESAHGVLPREDPDAARIVEAALARDGVRLHCCGKDLKLSRAAAGKIRMQVESHGQAWDVAVDQLLVAAGRAPNVESLGLEAAGIVFNSKGVEVDDRLRTTNPRVFACGDVCSPFQFTHAADFQARIVIRNALFGGRAKASALVVPWCTYTSPEVAQVGLTARDAAAAGVQVDTFTEDLDRVDRSILDGETDGFVRVHVRRGTDRIVGATVVAPNAGDLISELTVAMTAGLGLKSLASTIHPYPTVAEAIRRCGDAYNRTRLTPSVRRLAEKWLAWRRR